MAAERETIQTAMNAMMAERDITTVAALVGPANGTNAFAALPTGDGAAVLYGTAGNRYLKTGVTNYYYCWTAGGEIYTRDPDPEVADDLGICSAPP